MKDQNIQRDKTFEEVIFEKINNLEREINLLKLEINYLNNKLYETENHYCFYSNDKSIVSDIVFQGNITPSGEHIVND